MPTEEEIEKEADRLERKFEFRRRFATGINAKNYDYPTDSDFRERAIRNLQRRKLRRLRR